MLGKSLLFALFTCLSHPLLHLPDLSFHLLCGSVRSKIPCALPREESGPLANKAPLTDLLAADCEKAWIHPGWEDTMQKWYEWLEEMKKKDEKKNIDEMHQRKLMPTD